MKAALLLAPGLLSAILGAELLVPGEAPGRAMDPAPDLHPAAPPTGSTSPPGGPSSEQAAAVGNQVATILARPLFAAGRRPRGDSVATPASLPRLTGLMRWPSGTAAIFQPDGGARAIVRTAGQTIGEWTIREITAVNLTMMRGSDVMTIAPRAETTSPMPLPAETKIAARWEVAAPSGMLRDRWSNPQLQP